MPRTRPGIQPCALVLSCMVLAGGCGGGSESQTTEERPRETAPTTSEAPAATPAAGGSSTITGTVRYEGPVPPKRTLKMDADPGCAKKHSEPVESEVLVLGPEQALANVFVRVKSGLAGGTYPTPQEPAVIDQNGCRYAPHVLGVMTGQTVKILNSDGLLHNVHALPKINQTFNTAMPATRTEAEVTFTEEELFKVKCDVHPWMGAWVSVVSHPFFDVTGEDGRFDLEGLPAGSYEIEVWHEKLGSQTATAQVAENASAELEFTMSR